MPTTQVLVDELLDLGDGVSKNTGSYLRPRRKAKTNVQRSVDFHWTIRSWAFKIAFASGASEADAQGHGIFYLPADFLSFGREGGLAVEIPGDSKRRSLCPMPLRDYLRVFANPARIDVPNYYALGSLIPRGVFLYPTPQSPMTIFADYIRSAPACRDAGDPDETDTDELFLVPEQWHRVCIYERALYFQMKDKGNTQAAVEQKQIAIEGLKTMMVEERTAREAPSQIIPYGAGWGGLPR